MSKQMLIEEFPKPLRPIWNDAMKSTLVAKVGEIVFKWCNNGSELQDCIDSAFNVLSNTSDYDGYNLAKEFEDEGFDSDSDLVEELDIVDFLKDQILEAEIEKWVFETESKLLFAEGDTVVFDQIYPKKTVVGEIMKLYPERLSYGIYHEGLKGEKGKTHLIVKAEVVSKSPIEYPKSAISHG